MVLKLHAAGRKSAKSLNGLGYLLRESVLSVLVLLVLTLLQSRRTVFPRLHKISAIAAFSEGGKLPCHLKTGQWVL